MDGGVVPMNANKLCLQRRNHSSKVTLNSYTNNMSRLKSRPETETESHFYFTAHSPEKKQQQTNPSIQLNHENMRDVW